MKRNKLIQIVLASVQYMVKNALHSSFDYGASLLCRELLLHLMECESGRMQLLKELGDTPYIVTKQIS